MRPMRAGMLLALLCAASFSCAPALAQRGHDPGGQGFRGGRPQGHGDGAHFRGQGGYYGGAWRGGGHWEHGRVGGRTVWWWTTYPGWYYPSPVYPYYPYSYVYPYPWVPPSVAGAPLVSPAAPYLYYCDTVGGYYPYVTQCPGGFRAFAPSDPNLPAPLPGVR